MKDTFKVLFTILLIYTLSLKSNAQKSDYIWLSGYDSYVGFYPSFGYYFGTSVLDFNYNPRNVSYDSFAMNFSRTNTSYSDSDGNLLFYTNGIYVANSLDEKIQNGDSLNAGYLWYDWDPTIYKYGYRTPYGIYALPIADNPNQYYLVHTYSDSIGDYLPGKKVLLTLLDMSLNGGHGKVIYKNRTVIEDTLDDWGMNITRHGNGKDWWAILPEINNNCYYSILINDTGAVVISKSCSSVIHDYYDFGVSNFSPDGSWYAHLSKDSGLTIFNFDRCSGLLSNPLYRPIFSAEHFTSMGVAFSPNSRFLYVSLLGQLFQFDLWSQDIIGSIDTVGNYDGTEAPNGAFFSTQQLGPDGKIYMSCGNTDTVYHVINNPDAKGDSCDFRQHSLSIPSPSSGVPSFPNYRLGRLPGSACDTVWNSTDEVAIESREKILKVFPNPAADVVIIDYGFTDWTKTGEVSLEIANELGQVVYTQKLPQYSGFQKIDVSRYSTGIYSSYIKRNEQVVATQKFAKQ